MKIKYFLVLFYLLLSFSLSAQITASPTRVTKGVTVVIVDPNGGFALGDQNDIVVDIFSPTGLGNMPITNKKFINSNQLSFEVNTNYTEDYTSHIKINGVDTGVDIDYIRPNIRVLSNSSTSNQVERITEIFTTWDVDNDGSNFWRSSEWSNGDINTWPNDRHDLLAFTFNGTTYSTSVDDAKLTDNGVTFTPKRFKSYSTNGVEGRTNSSHYIIAGDALNFHLDTSGNEPSAIPTTSIVKGMSIFESLIDGVNGLDLGTGITNFNKDNTIKFFSGNGDVGAIGDGVPDAIITQIADASDGSIDIYFYADIDGNVVGRPVGLNIRKDGNNVGAGLLAKWRMDLFKFTSGLSFQSALPTVCNTNHTDVKTLKMAGLELDDFEIIADLPDTDPDYLTNPYQIRFINNINMAAGGNADIAFLAYNTDAFEIKSPIVNKYPLTQYICRFPNTDDVIFNAIADIEGREPGDAIGVGQELQYEWYRFNTITSEVGPMTTGAYDATFDILGGIDETDLGAYNLHIFNNFGRVILPVSIVEGGTPSVWDGTSFNESPLYGAAGISIADSNRDLIFAQNYNVNANEEGCNCKVQSGVNVVIPSGKTLKLHREITVAQNVAAVYDSDGDEVSPFFQRELLP